MRGSALLGYVPVGNVGLVLLATRIRDVLTLPGGHVVKLVVESKWYTVPLEVREMHVAALRRRTCRRLLKDAPADDASLSTHRSTAEASQHFD
jgi:hypothetical protein